MIDGSDEIKISASSVSLSEPHELEGVVSTLVSKQGRELTLTSDQGNVDPKSNIASFIGNVIIDGADGIKLYTNQLYVNTLEMSGESPVKIRAKGASWGLTAASMRTHRGGQESKRFVLFTGNVKLVYYPDKAVYGLRR